MIVINLKNYIYGSKALELVRKIDIYCNKAIVAVSFTDLKEIIKNTSLPIYAQHIDYLEEGRGTGYVIPESLVELGVKGTLLNHSEHPITFKVLKKTIERCYDAGLKVIVCASSLKKAKKIKKLKPFAIAFEDPKLIASGKSITQYEENELKDFVSLLEGSEIIALCGAGITHSEDVKKALELGCKGVLVSSIVAKNDKPEKFLKEASLFFS